MNKNFTSKLRVDKRIVELLSKSTYQKSFASAIRELVSNAYDADALSVNVSISRNFKTIIIEDDGNGMSETEFNKYLTIAGVKTQMEFTRRYKRKRIGQFGVGFLAVFPFCKSLEITTTVENSDEILHAKIPAIEFTQISNTEYVDEIPIYGTINIDRNQRLKHYTKIRFIEPNYNVQQYFSEVVESRKRGSIINYDPFEKFIWELQEDLPISYSTKSKSFKIFKYQEPIGIIVIVNDQTLYRNELQEIILDQGEVEISGIKCSYVFSTNYKSILPFEARGIKRRVNNVGIGARTDFELKRDRGFSRLHWISGEIHYSEKIKEHLTLSRDSFVINPVIDELNDFFADKLKEMAYYVEHVAVAEKMIEQTFQETKRGNVQPKEEIIVKNLKKLEDKGFKIIHKEESNVFGFKKSAPIEFDKKEKTVTVIDKAETTKDYINLSGRKIEIQFISMEVDEYDSPCKIIRPGIVQLNKDFPLFKSKTYGNLFKKLYILLSFAEKESQSSEEMFNYLIKRIQKEFDNYK